MVASSGIMSKLTWDGRVRRYVEEGLNHEAFDIHAGDWLLAQLFHDAADEARPASGYGYTLPPYSALLDKQVGGRVGRWR